MRRTFERYGAEFEIKQNERMFVIGQSKSFFVCIAIFGKIRKSWYPGLSYVGHFSETRATREPKANSRVACN